MLSFRTPIHSLSVMWRSLWIANRRSLIRNTGRNSRFFLAVSGRRPIGVELAYVRFPSDWLLQFLEGKLSDGREIAVKKLSTSSNQGKKEFMNEAKLLARVQHRNVVGLVGYCAHGAEKLLVYEYVANESLDKFIFSNNPGRRNLLDWKRRYDIIGAVARGLLYLHEDSHCKIIHRDIKASNILLDDKWIPKIADFGMARLFPEGQTHVNTRVAGSNGYMAPGTSCMDY